MGRRVWRERPLAVGRKIVGGGERWSSTGSEPHLTGHAGTSSGARQARGPHLRGNHRPQTSDHRAQTDRLRRIDHWLQSTDHRPQTREHRAQTIEHKPTEHRISPLMDMFVGGAGGRQDGGEAVHRVRGVAHLDCSGHWEEAGGEQEQEEVAGGRHLGEARRQGEAGGGGEGQEGEPATQWGRAPGNWIILSTLRVNKKTFKISFVFYDKPKMSYSCKRLIFLGSNDIIMTWL